LSWNQNGHITKIETDQFLFCYQKQNYCINLLVCNNYMNDILTNMIWYFLQTFGTFYIHMVLSTYIWYFLHIFCTFYIPELLIENLTTNGSLSNWSSLSWYWYWSRTLTLDLLLYETKLTNNYINIIMIITIRISSTFSCQCFQINH